MFSRGRGAEDDGSRSAEPSPSGGREGGPTQVGRSAVTVGLALLTVLSVVAVPTAGLALDAPDATTVSGGQFGATAPGIGDSSGGPSADKQDASSSANGKNGEAPGNSGDAPGRSGDAPGKSGDAPGRSDDDDDDGPVTPTPAGGNGNGPNDAGPPDHAKTPGGPSEQSNAGGDSAAGEGRGPPDGATDGSRSGGPSVSVTRGPPDASDAPGDADRGPPTTPPGRSVVGVAVSNVRAGDDVSVDVAPSPDARAPVAFERLSLTARRGGDFTMRVVNSREPLVGSPAFETDAGTEALGHIRLEHSIANEDVASVSFVVRVEKDRLRTTGVSVEDVTLYRHADGEWTALPTDIVGETRTAYAFRVDSPGMSEFAVGAERTTFDTYWAEASDARVESGGVVRVSARVSNEGGADGTYEAELVVDGEVVTVRQVTVAAGGTRQVNFRWTAERPGTHTVRVGDATVGQVTVTDAGGGQESAAVGQAFSVALDRVLDIGRILLAP